MVTDAIIRFAQKYLRPTQEHSVMEKSFGKDKTYPLRGQKFTKIIVDETAYYSDFEKYWDEFKKRYKK